MNDGIYYPFSEERFLAYQNGMKTLVEKVRAKGIKVCLMSPLPFDAVSFSGRLLKENEEIFSYMEPYERYGEVLKCYSRWLEEDLKEQTDVFIDLNEILKDDTIKMRQFEKTYISGDGIHPGKHGNFVIARSILESLFYVSVDQLEKLLEQDGGCLFDLMCRKDQLLHACHKESIGHDNPNKSGYLTGELLESEVQFIQKQIEDYMERNEKKLMLEEEWESYRVNYFYFEGYEATIAFADIELLKRGYCAAGLRISNLYGAPQAVEIMERFRQMIVERFSCESKPVLFGFSRGGLYALHYAAAYPGYVDKIYFDAPVVDINSWPAKLEDGNSKEWSECRCIWGIKENFSSFRDIITKALDRLIAAEIPVILVSGDSDEVVPYEENGLLIEKHYQKKEIPCKVIIKPGVGHHPHSLEKPDEIIEFIMRK